MNSTVPGHPRVTRVVACLGGAATRIEQRQLPPPGPGELLLATRAVGLCGTDLFKLQTGTAAPGTVLGHELVGDVVDTGEGVDAFAIGDRLAVPHHVPCGRCRSCLGDNETLCATFRENLMSPGGFSDLVLIRARAVASAARRVPSSLPDEVAVWMEPAACVLRGVDRSGVLGADGVDTEGAGRVAVVQGAGSMGCLHLLVLKALAPRLEVTLIDPAADRRALALRLGADAALAPDDPAGASADAVFDTVGGAGLLDQALSRTREGGTVVLFAHAPDGDRAGFDINALFRSERRVIGSYSGTPGEQARILSLMAQTRLDPSPLVSHKMDLAHFAEAVTLTRRRDALKVILTGTASTQVTP